jgi:hypothetical protein
MRLARSRSGLAARRSSRVHPAAGPHRLAFIASVVPTARICGSPRVRGVAVVALDRLSAWYTLKFIPAP